MEAKYGSSEAQPGELAGLFSDLVRLETELWDRVDRRLREDHDLPLSWFASTVRDLRRHVADQQGGAR